MPIIRVELRATREEGKKVLSAYRRGGKDRRREDEALNVAWGQGRTPTGHVHFAGLTNGQPPELKFDVEIDPDIDMTW